MRSGIFSPVHVHVHNFTVSISNDTPGFVYRTGSRTRSAGNQIAEVRTGHSVAFSQGARGTPVTGVLDVVVFRVVCMSVSGVPRAP